MNQSVVHLQEIESGIALITMQDKVNKNTFTKEFISGLFQTFESVEANPNFKIVVLTGYDSYFASGGTQELLMAMHEGKMNFIYEHNKKYLHTLPLDCKIPVISAMQGHGIGAGFTFGLLADVVIFSRESYYSANYMKYGFTPGFGATYILPEKLGKNLGKELLFNAANYQGAELERRGVQHMVLPREKVLEKAMELARQWAERPRLSLVMLKDHLNATIREKLPLVIQQELEMHEKTFHLPEVKENIISLFGK